MDPEQAWEFQRQPLYTGMRLTPEQVEKMDAAIEKEVWTAMMAAKRARKEGNVRKDWSRLSFGEWLQAVISVPCPQCRVPALFQCVDAQGNDINPHNGRRTVAHDEWVRLRAEEIAKEDAVEDEVHRRCPWCGWLAGSLKSLKKHEEECDG